MRQFNLVLLKALVALGLVLSGAPGDSLLSVGATDARVYAAGMHKERIGSADLASAQKKRRLDRRADRRHDLDQDRKHDRTKADRGQDRKQKDRKPDRKQKDANRDRLGTGERSEPSPEDRYIVVFKRGTGNPTRTTNAVVSDSANVTITHVYDQVLDGFAAVIPDDQLDSVRDDPRVQVVVPDQKVQVFGQTLPTGIARIDADQHPTAKIGSGARVDVDVAVLDTGIATHEDLNVAGGISCLAGNTSFADDHGQGHGTHVAGTIGAMDNAIGVVGVAPGARLWAVKVLDANGKGWTSDVICGLNWVAQSGTIDVVNMSLGFYCAASPCLGDAQLHDAIRKVVNANIAVVVAAGNGIPGTPGGVDAKDFRPAAYDEVITVSALADSDGKPGGQGPATWAGADDSLASFSNFGADVDIAAPGVNILSTVPGNGYRGSYYGTSMASPHVAGAAALFLATNQGATPAAVRNYLLTTRKAIALPEDPDGINEGVLCLGECADPPPTVNPAPPPDEGATSPKKDKHKDKHKGQKNRGKNANGKQKKRR